MKRLAKIYNYVMEHDGITLNLKEKDGFMVPIKGLEKVINADNKEEFKKALNEYRKILKVQQKQYYNKIYIGLWKECNKIYFDLSMHLKDEETAKTFGVLNNQLAIFNIKKQCSIYLNN